jgi:hypothetical protein
MPINFYETGVYDLSITKTMVQSFDITFVSFMYGDFLYAIRKQWEQKQTSHTIWLLILNLYLFRCKYKWQNCNDKRRNKFSPRLVH